MRQLILAAAFLCCQTAYAVQIHLDIDGETINSVQGLQAGGFVYDVEFIESTFDNLKDNGHEFIFTSEGSGPANSFNGADVFAQALAEALPMEYVVGRYDPARTSSRYSFYVPYRDKGITNDGIEVGRDILPDTEWAVERLYYTQNGSYVFAVATVTSVPIPAAFWLLGSALGLLSWMRRLQHSN